MVHVHVNYRSLFSFLAVSYGVTRRLLKALYECHPVEQDVFLKGHDIKAAIVNVERDVRGHPLNPNL